MFTVILTIDFCFGFMQIKTHSHLICSVRFGRSTLDVRWFCFYFLSCIMFTRRPHRTCTIPFNHSHAKTVRNIQCSFRQYVELACTWAMVREEVLIKWRSQTIFHSNHISTQIFPLLLECEETFLICSWNFQLLQAFRYFFIYTHLNRFSLFRKLSISFQTFL